MLKKIFGLVFVFVFCFSLLPFVTYADGVVYSWAKKVGGTSDDFGQSISVDSSGNSYITGVFYGTADFDPGEGTANLTSAGSTDVFILKLDSSGNYVWAKKVGGADSDFGQSISVDSSGNSYITGYFARTVDFDPGAGTANLTSSELSYDVFILKLNSSGNYVWAKSVGGTGGDQGSSISVDSSGNSYITGYFHDTADFDPGEETANLTSAGSADIFILKLDSSGNYAWAKSVGGTSDDYAQSISVDSSGNSYITGVFYGTADFDPGEGTANLTSAGSAVAFILKLDSSGNYAWAKKVGGTGGDYGFSISVDSSGNSYITGMFCDTADFDPGAGTANLTSSELSYDVFILKLDSSGNYVWAKSVGGTGGDQGSSISVDSSGNSYITGMFYDTADFDPGAGTANLTSAGGADVFILKLDSSGNYVWAKSVEGTGNDFSQSISVDSSGNSYITGVFYGTADFDPGTGTANLTSSAGSYDVFILKLGPDTLAPTIENITPTPSDTGATINWTTNEPSTSHIDYGLTTNYTGDVNNDTLVESHEVTIDSLVSCTTYHYRISSTDEAMNNTTTTDSTFTTLGCPGESEILTQTQSDIPKDDGGTIDLTTTNGNDIIIFVPPNTTTDDIIIQAKELPSDKVFQDIKAPSSVTPVGNSVFNFTALSTTSTTITIFNKQIQITFPYTADQTRGLIKSSLSVYRYDGSTWIKLNDCKVNTQDMTVTCTTDHFSIFGLFGKRTPSSGSIPLLEVEIPTTNTENTPLIPIVNTQTNPITLPTITIKYGMTNDDVKALQIYLNTHGFPLSSTGPGSPNNETNYFGLKTKAAVIKFQIANKLIGDGIVGPKTRGEMR